MGIEQDLYIATRNWTLPVIVRDQKNDAPGRKRIEAEAAILGRHGYVPATQSAESGHLNIARTVMTGLLLPSRSGGRIIISFRRDEALVAQIEATAAETNRAVTDRLPVYAQVHGLGFGLTPPVMRSVGMMSPHLQVSGAVVNNGGEVFERVEIESLLFRVSDRAPGPRATTIVIAPPPGRRVAWRIDFPPTPRGVAYSVGATIRNLSRDGSWLEVRLAEPAAASVDAEQEPPSQVPLVVEDRTMKVCPDCAETILAAARVCRFCRHEFAPASAD